MTLTGTLFTDFDPTAVPPDMLTSQIWHLICVKTSPDILILVGSSCDILQLFLANIYGISGGIAEFKNTSIEYLAYKSASRLTLRSIFMFLQGPEHSSPDTAGFLQDLNIAGFA